ncbi:MAG: OmpA family protein [Bacteroidetes bacterium]|nr:OmpA family protein [Bacteroidota bacterium]
MVLDDLFQSHASDGEHWIPISDMMSGLMVIFLFISVAYMIKVSIDNKRIKDIAVTYNRLQNDLYLDLEREFRADLPRWKAVIDRQTLSVRWESPEVLFTQGGTELRPQFKEILEDFFPRYVAILTSPKYNDDIEEVRIEGHTSSEWRYDVSLDSAYLLNMELSQNRTRSVLEFVLSLPDARVQTQKDWLKKHVTANGLSSSKLIFTNGREDKEASRRVEFRVRTNAEKRIVRILSDEP